MEAIIFTCMLILVVILIFIIGVVKNNPLNEDSTDTETMSESSQSS